MNHRIEYDVTTIEGIREFQKDHQPSARAQLEIIDNFLRNNPDKATEKLARRQRSLTKISLTLERIIEGLTKNITP